jgi:hypothetical protein
MKNENQTRCAGCRRSYPYSGDWFGDLCPGCADQTKGEWICHNCGKRGDFEPMNGGGMENPICCGRTCEHIREKEPMQELKLTVPTYVANMPRKPTETNHPGDFGSPYVPVLIHQAEGVRIVLGTHNYEDYDRPDVQIERRPNGWAIFLHPSAGDPCGYVYFLDDGRSFLVPEWGDGAIEVLAVHEDVPELDRPQANPQIAEREVEPPAIKIIEPSNDMPQLDEPV